MAEVVKSNVSKVTVQVEIDLKGSLLEMEQSIQDAVNEVGTLATEQALTVFDTNGAPIQIGVVLLFIIWCLRIPQKQMAKVNVICSNCDSANTIKAGVDKLKSSPDGVQKYRCKDCGKYFRLKYKAIGRLPKTKEQIVDMCNNGSGYEI